MRTLILGGARSGKSVLAERLAAEHDAVLYIATAAAGDDEMAARIDHHRARRPAHWRLDETPLRLANTLRREAHVARCLLVDCLTLWLSNLLCAGDEAQFERERAALLDAIETCPGELILVSNEVGQGVVPLGALTRRFVDEAGRLHQDVAARCDRVVFTIAGLPQVLKGSLGAGSRNQ
ncbi:MAG TPA: bifunctional adenosylcobinamide kinase/adenosylcobinamide-phosphate guanylyltransferase [Tahibacter sp.]|uniref:bifunctional adenosylcobinamide kinase/adenosylcobinamide-phosphate guanylyltransferase n=1 Tax=Tahibacter sp. TaxID=2056211 RepID=UPI002B777381|nr:bifunctional adenosylcobinamide kinase/adenosylcobinamide-phosphate guanylyltransferase [Tahibacter sp.]HSX59338.1 bifunctional adenosylcobinamide kinase/adenosylcobinamide-phosphate guanylyltransferase [Tahibacter sp.]